MTSLKHAHGRPTAMLKAVFFIVCLPALLTPLASADTIGLVDMDAPEYVKTCEELLDAAKDNQCCGVSSDPVCVDLKSKYRGQSCCTSHGHSFSGVTRWVDPPDFMQGQPDWCPFAEDSLWAALLPSSNSFTTHGCAHLEVECQLKDCPHEQFQRTIAANPPFERCTDLIRLGAGIDRRVYSYPEHGVAFFCNPKIGETSNGSSIRPVAHLVIASSFFSNSSNFDAINQMTCSEMITELAVSGYPAESRPAASGCTLSIATSPLPDSNAMHDSCRAACPELVIKAGDQDVTYPAGYDRNGWTGTCILPHNPTSTASMTYHTYKCISGALVKYSGCRGSCDSADCHDVNHNSPEYLQCQQDDDGGGGSHQHHCGQLGNYSGMPDDVAYTAHWKNDNCGGTPDDNQARLTCDPEGGSGPSDEYDY